MDRNTDNRSYSSHKIHQWGHEVNGAWKDTTGKGAIESTPIYRYCSPGKNGRTWDSNVDWKRAEYHRKQANEKGCLIF